MFTTLGLFKDIPCPEGQRCALMKCIFSHDPTDSSSNGHGTSHQVQMPLAPEGGTTISTPSEGRGPQILTEEPTNSPKPQPSISNNRQPAGQDTSTLWSPASKKLKPTPDAPKPRTLTAVVSPPPLQNATASPPAKRETSTSAKPGARLPPRNAPRESLNPRMLPKPPSTHAVRMSILKKLHAAMTSLNEKMITDKDSGNQSLALSPEELITMALDEEEKAAKDNPSVYANVIKLRIVRLTKMSKEDWATEVKTHLNERYYKLAPIQSEQQKPTIIMTGLSVEEEIAVVRKLLTPLEGLENYGYVTRAPTEREIESAIKGVTESKGWEKCERCGGRFQVFPGRREDGSLTTGGSCTHHPGKPLYPPRKKTDRIVGSREAYFSCCNEPLGASSGCTKSETHVFKVSEAKRLASVLQFETTPEKPDKESCPPVCFDCEMGYTTLGLELIRLTAVSWPEGKELLDVLVRPIGEVLDLNSRFSGVYPEHYTKAVPYGSSSSSTARSEPTETEEGEIPPAPLQVVDSPATARSLLFKLLKPDTPLIGHAIDNDLNACRIIHPTIIDTVILFPAAGGLPNRMALRTLARRHLEREIQTGGSLGHDSKEDSIATGDLVRFKVAETWKRLKSKGWLLQQGTLVAPPGATEDDIADWKLGNGAGQKRKIST